MGGGGVEDLLDAVHVAGEAGHDDPPRCGAEDLVDRRGEVALGGGEPGDLGVGGVDEEQVDAFLAEAGERAQVGDSGVERELVHLEVAGVQHGAGAGADGDGEPVGDGVVDRGELEVERAERTSVALGDPDRRRGDPVLLELRPDERQRQA